MPRQYEDIRDSYVARGMPLKEAKRIAAMTYIARGKGRKGARGRSARAKSLHRGK